MRALVTGAGGFIGTYLVDHLLQNDWIVVALTGRRSSTAKVGSAGSFSAYGDILDDGLFPSLMASHRFDVVFHLAGLNAFADAFELNRVNILGTVRLLQAAKAIGRPDLRIVLLGSSAEYGVTKDDPIAEDCALAPVTNYGVSKACMDLMGQALFRETGQNVVCARPFNVVGPGLRGSLLQSAVIDQLVAIERNEAPPVLQLGDLTGYRDFIDVRDVVSGLVALAEHGSAGQAYNLCSGQAHSAGFVVDYLLGLVGLPIEIRPKTDKTQGINVPYQCGSFEKANRATGWTPRRSLESSLADALAFRRESIDRH